MKNWLKPMVILLLLSQGLDNAADAFMDAVEKNFDVGSVPAIVYALLYFGVAALAWAHWQPGGAKGRRRR